MTDSQSKAAMEFYLGLSLHRDKPYMQPPAEPLFREFGTNFKTEPARLIEILDETLLSRRGDDVESILAIAQHFEAITAAAVPLFCRLLLADFHACHEDIARYLQSLRDPRSITALYEACFLDLPYFWDHGDALARKCTWALHDIGTPEAFDRLKALTSHPRDSVVAFALKRLPPEGQPP